MAFFIVLLSFIACVTNAVPVSDDKAKCGLPAIKPDTSTDIVGGKDAIPYSWPWQVALTQFGFFQFCAGSLISPQWVVTAGHCFDGATDPSRYQVKLGVFSKSKNNEPGEQVLDISEIHVHPEYKDEDPKMFFDVALLKLKSPVTFTDHISPACLPNANEELPDAGSTVFVTGWGDTRENGQDSETLKQVAVPLQSNAKCVTAYKGKIHEETQFCAGFDNGGKDACNGDSGGPIVFQDKTSGIWKQIGIVSTGTGCARPKLFGIYSKMPAFMDFIKQYVTDL